MVRFVVLDDDVRGIVRPDAEGPCRVNVVRYNISQNDSRRFALGAITVYNSGTGISGLEIFNNTIYIASGAMTPWAVHIANPTTNVHLRNNILFTAGGARTFYVGSGQSGIEFQRNDYWNGGAPVYLAWGSSVYTDANSWRFATSQETVNGVPSWVSVAPHLTSPGGGGTINNSDLLNTLSAYKLLSTSPMINSGLNLQSQFGVAMGANDFYGVAIPRAGGAYDIGASEY